MPTESGLMTDAEVEAARVAFVRETREAILAAKDAVTKEAVEEITEATAIGRNKSRPTVKTYASASLGKTVRETIVYMNPPDSKGWGAIREIKEEVL
jgi:hypothetical protein